MYSFVTFTIGDLFRCKIKSREKEIVHIYHRMVDLSKTNPEVMKIIRIKNRLNDNNRDILINFKLYDKLIAEVQLAIGSEINKEVELANNFSHFIY